MHDGGRLIAPMHQLPESEAGTLHRRGARHAALVCGTEVFHNPADRWPDALDITTLASLRQCPGHPRGGACTV